MGTKNNPGKFDCYANAEPDEGHMDLSYVKPACVIEGVPWYDFGFEYEWEGKTYGFHVCARSAQEAQDRLKRLPLARFLGPEERVRMPGGPLWLARIWLTFVCSWRNWRTRRGQDFRQR